MILDYVRKEAEGMIVVPPFHTGHLGFIPGTEVSVSLTWAYEHREGPCEVCVTPFDPHLDSMCLMECTMYDAVGVVSRLVDAVSALNVNIVKMETSAINYQYHHKVEMVLDWRTSKYVTRRPTPPDLLYRYDDMRQRLPLSDYRYVRLYETIMSFCGDVLHYDSAYGDLTPAIRIIPFQSWQALQTEHAAIEKRDSRSYHVQFRLPDAQLAQIRGLTDHASGEPLPYILNSETAARTLRVFFPRRAAIPRLAHVAVTHSDFPGALSAITRVLASRRLNILTSLLRKKTSARSGYEAFLECPPDGPLPPQPTNDNADDVLQWFKSELDQCSDEDLAELQRFDAVITVPEYPRRSHVREIKIESRDRSRPTLGRQVHRRDAIERVQACLDRIDDREKPPTELDEAQKRYLLTTRERLKRDKPRVFLSYPAAAKGHAEMLKASLRDLIDPQEYQLPDFGAIVQQVIERVRDCDYFIGVWHHEELAAKAYTVSPWMPFEYGVALEAGIKCVVVYSERLPETIWRRINPGISHAEYSDLTFESRTIPLLVNHVQRNWIQAKAS